MSGSPPEPEAPPLHPSAAPARQRRVQLELLRAGRLPGQFLYQSPAQARRWLAYHDAWSPSRADAAVQALYQAACRAAAAAIVAIAHGGRPLCLVGLGCGGGSKDAALLEALRAAAPERALHYAPLDASAELVRASARLAGERIGGVALHPLVVDLAAAPALATWLDARAPGAMRLYSCLGMLPNQHPLAFPAWLTGLLRPGERLLLSANLSPAGLAADGARILAQYDNPPARAWVAGALAELGLAAQDYRLEIGARPLALDVPGLAPDAAWEIVVEAVLQQDVALALHGQTLPLTAGHRLRAFHSLRITRAAAEALLARAGLAVGAAWVDATGEEGFLLCALA